MNIRKLSLSLLSLLLLCGCSSSKQEDEQMTPLKDYNSVWSQKLASSESE